MVGRWLSVAVLWGAEGFYDVVACRCNTLKSIIVIKRPPTTETRNSIANNSQRGRARGAACVGRCGSAGVDCTTIQAAGDACR